MIAYIDEDKNKLVLSTLDSIEGKEQEWKNASSKILSRSNEDIFTCVDSQLFSAYRSSRDSFDSFHKYFGDEGYKNDYCSYVSQAPQRDGSVLGTEYKIKMPALVKTVYLGEKFSEKEKTNYNVNLDAFLEDKDFKILEACYSVSDIESRNIILSQIFPQILKLVTEVCPYAYLKVQEEFDLATIELLKNEINGAVSFKDLDAVIETAKENTKVINMISEIKNKEHV